MGLAGHDGEGAAETWEGKRELVVLVYRGCYAILTAKARCQSVFGVSSLTSPNAMP